MHNTLKTLICLSMLLASAANATSPCTGDGCHDEASAAFLAPFDFFEAKCSLLNPGMQEQYSAVTAHFLKDENVAFLKKLRASEPYARLLAKMESIANSLSSDELGKACEDFLKEK